MVMRTVMRTRMLAVLLAFAVVAAFGGEVSAHGLSVVLERRGDVVVAVVRYDGGIPVVGADVVIRAPGVDEAYQTGRTDPAGRFVFVPAEPGEWQVMVDDGMGHRRTARLTLESVAPTPAGAGDDDGAAGAGAGVDAGTGVAAGVGTGGGADGTRPWRLATGLSLLFGITGFGYGYSARKGKASGA
jgi:nickel transport protein